MANALGKRYVCQACNQQVLCLKPGNGTIACCGQPMQQEEPRHLPSAD